MSIDVIVNGKKHAWDCCIITHHEVVNLAYPVVYPSSFEEPKRSEFTVTYDGARRGAGTLIDTPEDEIEVQCGMVFDVTYTGRA